MKVLILYRDLSGTIGGTERVLSAFVRLFKELGHYVKLISFDGGWNSKFLGAPPDEIEKIRIPRVMKLLKLSDRTIFRVSSVLALMKTYLYWSNLYDYILDLIYNDLRGSPDIGYVHYLSRKLGCDNNLFKFDELPSYIVDFLFRPKARYIFANSSWTLGLVRGCGVDGFVLHPPVEPIDCGGVGKEDLVVGLGRLSKPWEEFIEIAKAVKEVRGDIKFVIAGYASSEDRVRELRALARDYVTVIPNIDEEFKRNLLCRAKAILHTHPAEHFGIAIVEAMSTGAVPIVHKDGGAWFDIVEGGRYGYGYNTINEAVEAVINAVSMGNEKRQEIRQKATQYTYKNFKQKILKIVKDLN